MEDNLPPTYTMANTRQHTIRVPDDLWEAFKALCAKPENDTNVTDQLILFMRYCCDDLTKPETHRLPDRDTEIIPNPIFDKIADVESRLREEFAAMLDERLGATYTVPTQSVEDTPTPTQSAGIDLTPTQPIDSDSTPTQSVGDDLVENTVTLTSSNVIPTDNRTEPIESTSSPETEETHPPDSEAIGNGKIAALCESAEEGATEGTEGAIGNIEEGITANALALKRFTTSKNKYQATQVNRAWKKEAKEPGSFAKWSAGLDHDKLPWTRRDDGLFYLLK